METFRWCPELAFGEVAQPRSYQATSGLRRGGGRPAIVRPRLDVPRCPHCAALAGLCSRTLGGRRCDDTTALALRALARGRVA